MWKRNKMPLFRHFKKGLPRKYKKHIEWEYIEDKLKEYELAYGKQT